MLQIKASSLNGLSLITVNAFTLHPACFTNYHRSRYGPMACVPLWEGYWT